MDINDQQPEVIRPAYVEVLDNGGRPIDAVPPPDSGRIFAPVSWTLLLLNVAVFIYFNARTGQAPAVLAYAPDAGQIFPQLLTYMFAHASGWHLLGNMLIVFTVGMTVEQIYGTWRYTLIYLSAGIVSALVQAALIPHSALVGASGAASAVLVLFARHLPQARLYLFALIPVPAWLVIVLWAAFNVLGQMFWHSSPIAFMAHLVGMTVGLLLSLLLLPPGRRGFRFAIRSRRR